MRDEKDHATIDLPGFEPPPARNAQVPPPAAVDAKRPGRPRGAVRKQEQLALLDLAAADATGLPVWQRDPNLDVTGLPVWQPSKPSN
jgi:hypothetical protein